MTLRRRAGAGWLRDPHRLLGLAFIFTVALIWVAASFVVQGIEDAGVDAAVLTFIANSLFAGATGEPIAGGGSPLKELLAVRCCMCCLLQP